MNSKRGYLAPILCLFLMIFISGCVRQGNSEQAKTSTNESLQAEYQQPIPAEYQQPVDQKEQKDCAVNFTHYFVDPAYVQKVGQIGTLHGSGQFTVGRSYIFIKNGLGLEKIPIYAPTEMYLSTGSYYQVPAPAGQDLGNPLPDYALNFDAGCGVEVHLGHLKEVVPEISRQFSQPKGDSRTQELQHIKFNQGDLVGYFKPNSGVAAFDFMVHDQYIINQFANNARQTFDKSDNLIHIACPYDYYSGEMKEEYYNLIGGYISNSNKECGPASRDFPGTVSGLWFLEKEINRSMYDYYQEGNYGSLMSIVGDVDRVLIGKIRDRTSIFIYPGDATYKDPKEIIDAHCYQLHSLSSSGELEGYIFLKLTDSKTLKITYSEHGKCPGMFPETGAATYYR